MSIVSSAVDLFPMKAFLSEEVCFSVDLSTPSHSDFRISSTRCSWKVQSFPASFGFFILRPFYSGKTSLIHSLAGELGLDIYVVSLSAKGIYLCVDARFPLKPPLGMSDNTLSTLMGNVPSRFKFCIRRLLTFTHSL